MLKRIVLFILTNLAVVLVLGVVLRILGLDRVQFGQDGGLNYQALLVFAAVVGFTGSFISLALSKWMAKMSTGARVIQQPQNEQERWLVATVERLARKAGIGMPEVAIFETPDMNAFATGARRNNALVAVSTGLLRGMSPAEAEAVIGHEIAHVANGDMVTLTLIQGVVNTFVIFISRVVGHFVDRVLFRSEDDERSGYGPGYWITTMVTELLLGILATMIVMWFSRRREFRADKGGATLTTKGQMTGALQRLRQAQVPSGLPENLTAFGIRAGGNKLLKLFSSHPPLEERIAVLQSIEIKGADGVAGLRTA